MKYIKSKKEYSFDNYLNILERFINGKISETELFEKLDSYSIDESVFSKIKDFITTTKDKTEEGILNLCIK